MAGNREKCGAVWAGTAHQEDLDTGLCDHDFGPIYDLLLAAYLTFTHSCGGAGSMMGGFCLGPYHPGRVKRSSW